MSVKGGGVERVSREEGDDTSYRRLAWPIAAETDSGSFEEFSEGVGSRR